MKNTPSVDTASKTFDRTFTSMISLQEQDDTWAHNQRNGGDGSLASLSEPAENDVVEVVVAIAKGSKSALSNAFTEIL